MRKSYKIFWKSFFISLLFCTILVAVGYFFIEKNLKSVVIEENHVPYTQEAPDSAGVMLSIENDRTFIYLDFDNEEIYVSLNPQEQEGNQIWGYDIDYEVFADYNLLEGIVDYVGGIELETNGITFRYTGIQIAQMYNSDTDQKREIVKQICKKIGENGVAIDFFSDIIQNRETNLKISDCYFWDDYLSDLCKRLKIID